MKKKPLTRRQEIDKLKVRWYNQMRNLLMKQHKELSKFYESEQTEELEKQRRKIIKDANIQPYYKPVVE